MIGAIAISTGGLAAASQRVGIGAEAIARFGTSLPSATQVDLSAMAVRLIEDKAAFGLNAAILKSSLEMSRRALDILA